MDVRDARGLAGRAVAGLDAFNRRHPWSHNDHFHGWILRNLPAVRRHALDVGCGRGELASALATRFDRVDAVDADAEMVRIARERLSGDARITVRREPFDQVAGRYDLITMVAVLHHLDLDSALSHVAELLTTGGRLLVVGLARPVTTRDIAWDLTSAALNPVVGMVKHPRAAVPATTPPFPVADPTLAFDEVRDEVARRLPGAGVRRRLFFRYTLAWTKP